MGFGRKWIMTGVRVLAIQLRIKILYLRIKHTGIV